jgi:tetratricopeptide (TPR) repeat protein
MHDYKGAAQYYEQALEIRKQSLGEDHPDYAMSLNNLGILNYKMGAYQAAESYYQKALEIRKKVLGQVHPEYASSLITLGNLYLDMGDYQAAEPYYKQALEIYKIALGDDHPNYAMSLNNLGILYYDMGDYKAAEPYFEQNLEIKMQSLGEDHPDYIKANLNYAQLLKKLNRQDTAFRIYRIIFSQIAGYIANNFEWLSEKQRESYWEKEQDFFLNIPNFAVTYAKEIPAVTELNYNALLLVKSKLLEANLSKNRSMINLQDSAVNTIYEKLKFKRRYLAKLESEGNTHIDLIVRLHQEADSLDRLLVKQWRAYEQEKKHLLVKWNEVQSELSNEEMAIEFNRYYDTKDSCYRYQALLIKDKIPHPIAVSLCKEEDLQNILVKSGFSQFYNLIWQPLLPHLEGI